MAEYPKILFKREGAITSITLNDPHAHNALDRQMSDELHEAVRKVKRDRECRILIFRGAGDTFCAGDNIKDFLTWTEDDPYWQVRLYQETAKIIEDLTPVTIAAVDGVAAGGGLELTLVCDFVIATDRSRWGMPEIDWEITPGWGGTSRLSRVAGRRKAKEWNLVGALFDAATAERYDLINRICAADELDAEVAALTEVMLAKNPVTLRRTKFIMTQAADHHISAALAFEVPIEPFPAAADGSGIQGIIDFGATETRRQRRALSRDFWQDRNDSQTTAAR
jgi:enoyl-CoA hydratase/carnithine racemase